MLIFHAWVIYFFHSAACTTEQAALGPSLQVLAPQQSTSRRPLGVPQARITHPSPTLLGDQVHPPACSQQHRLHVTRQWGRSAGPKLLAPNPQSVTPQ